MSELGRAELERMAHSSVLPHLQLRQARGLMPAADGAANEHIARDLATTPDTVWRWRPEFETSGIDAVGTIAPGRGCRSVIDQP